MDRVSLCSTQTQYVLFLPLPCQTYHGLTLLIGHEVSQRNGLNAVREILR